MSRPSRSPRGLPFYRPPMGRVAAPARPRPPVLPRYTIQAPDLAGTVHAMRWAGEPYTKGRDTICGWVVLRPLERAPFTGEEKRVCVRCAALFRLPLLGVE